MVKAGGQNGAKSFSQPGQFGQCLAVNEIPD